MLPIPTPRALAAFVGCTAVLVLGLIAVHPAVTMLASCGLAALALALAATMPLGRRVRRQRLEFAWWLGHGDPNAAGGAVTPGAPFEVKCYVRHRGDAALLLASMVPLVPGGARIVPLEANDEGREEPDLLPLSPHGRTEFSFRLVAPAAGRVVLHGLAVTLRGPLGLFEVPLYFPNPLAIKVLPRAAARSRGGARTATALPVERSTRSLVRRRGGGTDLHELRELVPGDPFKSIAWKASARAGKLMVREVEREVQELRYVVLDVSGTMRGGAAGMRKLDWAIEAAAAEARRAVDAGDRVGILTVDGRILAHVTPGEGAKQMIHVYDALLAATEVVDQDLTDVDDDELVSIVARYVRNQDGLDFASKERPNGWEVTALVKHVSRALATETEREHVVASSQASALLRRFCRARGIPLPYRPDPRDGMKGPGLAAALREVGGRTREPCSIVCVTDLDGIGDPDALVAAVKLLRSRGHAVSFVVPDARTFAPPPRTELERDLFLVYGRTEERRIREANLLLGRLGVPVLVARRDDPPALIIARAAARRAA